MSLLSDLALSLRMLLTFLFRIGGPVLIALGTISCLLSLMVFGKKTLRKNPCSIFLMALNLSNLVYIYTSLLSVTMSVGYFININLTNRTICRLIIYNALVVDILSPCFLICASIDRIMITSHNARIRQRSTQRTACICVGIVTIVWLLFHSYALVSTDIIPLSPDMSICYFSSNEMLTLLSYYTLIVKAILVPCSMGICGFVTVQHTRRARRVAAPSNPSTNAPRVAPNPGRLIHQRDRQLILIILTDIGIYFICNLMIIAHTMYQQITQSYAKSYDQMDIEYSLRMIAIFFLAISFCSDFYSNMAVSKTFRQELKNTLLCK